MKYLSKFLLLSAAFCAFASFAFAQSTITKTDLSQTEIDRIIANFTGKEREFREALSNYVFNRYAVIQTVGLGGQITGEYRRDSFMTFGSDGARFEKILFAPMPTLKDLIITPADLEDLGGVNAFALEARNINLYNFTYIGKEKIDELDLYVFDVAPKVIPDPKKSDLRVFSGRIWVDDRDLQIVKSKGKALPEGKDRTGADQRFPVVETWRENVDGKYWFPAYASVTGDDGELVFRGGDVLRMKMVVKYTDYRQGRSDVKILDDVTDEPQTPAPTPSPTPKNP